MILFTRDPSLGPSILHTESTPKSFNDSSNPVVVRPDVRIDSENESTPGKDRVQLICGDTINRPCGRHERPGEWTADRFQRRKCVARIDSILSLFANSFERQRSTGERCYQSRAGCNSKSFPPEENSQKKFGPARTSRSSEATEMKGKRPQ